MYNLNKISGDNKAGNQVLYIIPSKNLAIYNERHYKYRTKSGAVYKY